MPICAAVIILTSLAPSPIANVVIFSFFFFSFTIFTISAFYFGETLQAITTFAYSHSDKNSLRNFYLVVIFDNQSPPTTTAVFLVYPIYYYYFTNSVNYLYNLFDETSLSTKISVSLSKASQLNPILIAVSILSPVRTQSLIPASFMKLITSPTSSYN